MSVIEATVLTAFFQRVGDEIGKGYTFPCDKEGVINFAHFTPKQKMNLFRCQENPDEYMYEGIKENTVIVSAEEHCYEPVCIMNGNKQHGIFIRV
jgi:hypothetical protein